MKNTSLNMNINNQVPNGSSHKVENDPWVPLDAPKLPNENGTAGLPLPQNPLYQMIDSEKYIQSLEQKLAKLTKSRVRQKEPTSRDIINSLAVFHEDQMRRYLDDSAEHCLSSNHVAVDDSSTQPSYLQRKIHPERQPLNSEEIAELLKEDVMAEKYEEYNVCGATSNTCTDTVQTDTLTGISQEDSDKSSEANTAGKSDISSCDNASQKESESNIPESNSSENWANFDQMNHDDERDS